MKKAGKTTKPLRYGLKKFPYNCTVEVTNTCKGLDLIDRLPKKLWTVVCNIVHEAMIKITPKKKKFKKAKYLKAKEKRKDMHI